MTVTRPHFSTGIYVVTVVGDEMGKYAGTRWPMDGMFSRIDDLQRLIERRGAAGARVGVWDRRSPDVLAAT